LCDNDFQTKEALALKALDDNENENVVRDTDSNGLSADRSVRSG